jgi:hypothetical protein
MPAPTTRTRGRAVPRGRRRADPVRRLELILIGSLILLSLIGGRLVQIQGLDRIA